MDEHYLEHPSEGVIRMQDMLFALGFVVNHKRVRQATSVDGADGDLSKEESKQIGVEEVYSSLPAEGPGHKPAKSGLGDRYQLFAYEERILVYNGHH